MRFSAPGQPYDGLVVMSNGHAQWTGLVTAVPDKLDEPLRRRKPTKYFVNSMSDLFHETMPWAFIDQVFAVMALAHEHTFQILTKRADVMAEYCQTLQYRAEKVAIAIARTPWYDSPAESPCSAGTIEERIAAGPLSNVHLGVSIEDQKRADERIPILLATPAAVRFLSVEPQLQHVNAHLGEKNCQHGNACCTDDGRVFDDPLKVWKCVECNGLFYQTPEHQLIPGIHWVICGGESGPGARPFDLAWAESLAAQCDAAHVPFFMKQIGSNPQVHSCRNPKCTHPDCGMEPIPMKDRKGGDPEEWPESLRIRQYPEEVARNARV